VWPESVAKTVPTLGMVTVRIVSVLAELMAEAGGEEAKAPRAKVPAARAPAQSMRAARVRPAVGAASLELPRPILASMS
jgi:hypothetical protein